LNNFISYEITIKSCSFGIVRKVILKIFILLIEFLVINFLSLLARRTIINKSIKNSQENQMNPNILKKDQEEYYACYKMRLERSVLSC
jgi:hypothetical protein